MKRALLILFVLLLSASVAKTQQQAYVHNGRTLAAVPDASLIACSDWEIWPLKDGQGAANPSLATSSSSWCVIEGVPDQTHTTSALERYRKQIHDANQEVASLYQKLSDSLAIPAVQINQAVDEVAKETEQAEAAVPKIRVPADSRLEYYRALGVMPRPHYVHNIRETLAWSITQDIQFMGTTVNDFHSVSEAYTVGGVTFKDDYGFDLETFSVTNNNEYPVFLDFLFGKARPEQDVSYTYLAPGATYTSYDDSRVTLNCTTERGIDGAACQGIWAPVVAHIRILALLPDASPGR